MKNVETLKNKLNMSTGKFVLLTIATAGVYAIVWFVRAQSVIEEETEQSVADKNYVIFLAAAMGWSAELARYDTDDTSLALGAIVGLVSAVLYIYWAFRAKAVLSRYALDKFNLDLKMNAFYTFIFNFYYVNYCINDLPDALKKQDILMNRYAQKV